MQYVFLIHFSFRTCRAAVVRLRTRCEGAPPSVDFPNQPLNCAVCSRLILSLRQTLESFTRLQQSLLL